MAPAHRAGDPADVRPAESLAERLLQALPQTQCTRCGYPDCAAYAQAMAEGRAPINQCPPGGAEGVRRLAALTSQAERPLNPAHGTEGPRGVAWIDEDWCIGCTLCIAACPVDCIVGSPKRMHTVIEAECTGCELCVSACPVDCIHMEAVSGERTGWAAWSAEQAASARVRYAATQQRRQHRPVAAPAPAAPTGDAIAPPASEPGRKRALIEAALARARQQRPQS
ncbi:MAG: RnfABCDGE type electron transport complex subunit B [Burkholderiaceae bacterium]